MTCSNSTILEKSKKNQKKNLSWLVDKLLQILNEITINLFTWIEEFYLFNRDKTIKHIPIFIQVMFGNQINYQNRILIISYCLVSVK